MTDQTHFPVIENVCIAVTYVDVIKSVLFRMFLVCSFLLLISSYFLIRFKTERSWLVKLHNFQKSLRKHIFSYHKNDNFKDMEGIFFYSDNYIYLSMYLSTIIQFLQVIAVVKCFCLNVHVLCIQSCLCHHHNNLTGWTHNPPITIEI